jgi:HEAT repeat protein
LLVTVRNVTATSTPTAEEVTARVDKALRGPAAKAMKRKGRLPAAALEDIQLGAVHHPDPHMRRWCLFLLDHFANDESMAIFATALLDDVPIVRDSALHGLTCEPCKDGELCVTDTVPHVIRILEADPEANLRIKAIGTLMWLSGRDPRAREALKIAARKDPDGLVRKCARDAVDGHFVPPKKRYERSQRRHAAVHH